ncbi:MAG TPA: hypothetical protein VLG12_06430 [Candidatus Saccharimonadales bacterium]|nr:hypothetical protein [Candidatus Saccharimonadales bacterium]
MARRLEVGSAVKNIESGPGFVGSGFVPIEGNAELMVIREEALQPGNLVYGADFSIQDVEEAFRSKVLDKKLANANRFTDQFISFAILSRKPFPYRYTQAQHYGPKDESDSQSGYRVRFAVIISGRDLVQAFPGQVMAVGGYFHNSYFAREAYRGFPVERTKEGKMEVYGIPIDYPRGAELVIPHRGDAYDDPYLDEVNLFAKKGDENVRVSKSLWRAIVVPEANWPILAAHADLLPNVPVFNSKCTRANLSLVSRQQ